MEIVKHANYSGPDPDPVEGRITPSGTLARRRIALPLSHVEVQTDLRKTWSFSDDLIHKGIEEGWIEYAGKPLPFQVHPDPGPSSPTRYASEHTVTLPGNELVMRMYREDRPVAVRYKITAPPVPRYWRVADESAPVGFSANHSFEVKLLGEDDDPDRLPLISGGSGSAIVQNIALGSFIEKIRDDATQVLLYLLKTVESDASLKDRATVATVMSNNTEADFASYGRKTGITATIVVDNTLDRSTADIPDQTFVAATTGQALHKVGFGYDEGGTDATRVPLTHQSLETTTDGSDLLIQVADFARAS